VDRQLVNGEISFIRRRKFSIAQRVRQTKTATVPDALVVIIETGNPFFYFII